jgi:aryl-alcohol dehydrogenase-like predicted oxidoreductase
LEYTRLPGCEQKLSRIAFGCEPLGGTDWGIVDQEAVMSAVCAAWDAGINVFDTAAVYGLGVSEERLSKALGTKRRDAFIITKCGLSWDEPQRGERAKIRRDSNPRRVIEGLESSLRRLDVETIPLYLVHWRDPDTPLDETIWALEKCREAGKVLHIGVSNYSAEDIEYVHNSLPLTAVELEYNLINRRAEQDVLRVCQRLGIGVLAYGPLAQGLLSGKFDKQARFGDDDRRSRLPHFRTEELERSSHRIDRLLETGKRLNRHPVQVAIRWVLEHPAITCAIVGAATSSQVLVNCGATGWTLGAGVRDSLIR